VAGIALAASLAYIGTVDASEPARPGRVANTDGSNLRVRAAPSLDAPIVKRLGPGWRLSVLGDPSGDGQWLRIEHGGTVGYVAVGYVAIGEGEAAPAPDAAARDGWVANTDGAALRLRETPELGAAILKRLEPGGRLTVLSEPVGGGQWLKVQHGATTGYVAAEFVSFTAPPSEPATAPAAPVASSGRAGWVANTDGSNLRLRAAASTSAEIVKRLEPGWKVTILDGPFTADDGAAWVRIEHGGVVGFAAAAYVAGSAAGGGDLPAPPIAGAANPRSAPEVSPIAKAAVVQATRLRDEPGLTGAIVTLLPAGATVQRTGREVTADGYRWASVRAYGRDGWTIVGSLGELPGADTGRQLAAEALAHVGRPYVWGGETPRYGFDCSGLVRYVVQRVTGIDLTHVLAYQAQAGSPVERDELEIGDMVFFRDTYKPGLSHVGFYLGNGQYVGAQNERAGVSRAQMDASYWRSRYYGARRLGE
jgi:cell wall-associated NlpC family hydrolase